MMERELLVLRENHTPGLPVAMVFLWFSLILINAEPGTQSALTSNSETTLPGCSGLEDCHLPLTSGRLFSKSCNPCDPAPSLLSPGSAEMKTPGSLTNHHGAQHKAPLLLQLNEGTRALGLLRVTRILLSYLQTIQKCQARRSLVFCDIQ